MAIPVDYDDLEHALHWGSSPPGFGAEAFVSRSTGTVWFRSADGPIDEDFPADIDDGLAYIAMPHKHDLDLGRDLVRRFVLEHAAHLERQVHEIFRRKGAYARFKALLARQDLLERWHGYENQATRLALQAWAADTIQYLAAAFHVFLNDSFRYVRELTGPRDAILEFQVTIDGIDVNGVDMIRWGDDGKIVDFKVMLRPLKAINLIHQKMGAMLQARQQQQ